jgi:hypothetical protein
MPKKAPKLAPADQTPSGDISVPASPADAINFALGVLDTVAVIAATLIGRGMLEPNAFQGDLKRFAEFWREKGNASRAKATEVLGERLKEVEKSKLKTKGHLVVPDTPRLN